MLLTTPRTVLTFGVDSAEEFPVHLPIRLVLQFTTSCVSVADKFGVVPVCTGNRFMRIRPADAILAHAFYAMYLAFIVVALAWLGWTEGVFAMLLVFLAFTPLTFILVSVVLRLTLEILRFANSA